MKRKLNKNEKYGTIDGGASKLFVRFGEGEDDCVSMSRTEFLSCKWLDENRFSGIKQFAGEYAHLAVPQTLSSLAQIYTESQLMELYDNMDSRGVSLFYLPEKQFTKVCFSIDEEYAKKGKKKDKIDTLMWYKWIRSFYIDNLQPAVRDFAKHRKDGEDYQKLVDITNVTLNTMRTGGYDHKAMYTESEFFPDGYDHAVEFMRYWFPHFDKTEESKGTASERSKCAMEIFSTLGVKVVDRREDPDADECPNEGALDILTNRLQYPLSTAVASMIEPTSGEVHRKSNGKFRSVDEIMRVVGSSPNHGKMGVARSNLYHHASHNTVVRRCKAAGIPIDIEEGRKFCQKFLTDEQKAIHKQTMRDMIRATKLCVRYVQKRLQGVPASDRLF